MSFLLQFLLGCVVVLVSFIYWINRRQNYFKIRKMKNNRNNEPLRAYIVHHPFAIVLQAASIAELSATGSSSLTRCGAFMKVFRKDSDEASKARWIECSWVLATPGT